MILYSQLYEREGNDAWLQDYIEVARNPFGLYLNHTVNHNGWNGEIKENHRIELDADSIEENQIKIDKYLEDNYLTEENGKGIKVNLKEIL